jgi:hypothetical protein
VSNKTDLKKQLLPTEGEADTPFIEPIHSIGLGLFGALSLNGEGWTR